jgi:photosystem II stability/assembly factor-like uncharacterized protein
VTVLLAATGAAVAVLEGEGSSWRASVGLRESGAQCVAVDPTTPGVAFAGCRGNGLFRSGDGGRSWDDCGLPAPDVFSVAVSPADGTVYAGCEPSSIFASTDSGGCWVELDALRSIPSAPTWSFPPRPWTSHVRWIAPSPHEPQLVLAGIELGGVMRTDDGGRTWQDHRPGAQLDVHQLAWHPVEPGRAYEAGGGGAAWSSDGGSSWQAADAGRDRQYTWALAVDAADPDRWYLSAAPGPFHAHGGRAAEAFLYRWREGRFEPVLGALAGPLEVMPYALAVADGKLYAGLRDGRIWQSADGGDSWLELSIEGDAPEALTALTPGLDA